MVDGLVPQNSLLSCACSVGRPAFDAENEDLADKVCAMLEDVSRLTGKCDVGINIIVAKVAAKRISELTDDHGKKLSPKDRARAEQEFVLLLESELAKYE